MTRTTICVLAILGIIAAGMGGAWQGYEWGHEDATKQVQLSVDALAGKLQACNSDRSASANASWERFRQVAKQRNAAEDELDRALARLKWLEPYERNGTLVIVGGKK